MFTSGEVRGEKKEMTVKTVSDDPGACLDRLAAREQKSPSSINDNETKARHAKQVEAAARINGEPLHLHSQPCFTNTFPTRKTV